MLDFLEYLPPGSSSGKVSTYVSPSSIERRIGQHYSPTNVVHANSGQVSLPIKVSLENVYCVFSKSSNKNTDSSAVDVAEMISLIKEVFGLNSLQIAQIAGFSRPAFYTHLKKGNMEPYTKLYELSKKVSLKLGSANLSQGLKSVLVDGKTLFAHLKSSSDQEFIVGVALSVAEKLKDRYPRALAVSREDQMRAVRGHSSQG